MPEATPIKAPRVRKPKASVEPKATEPKALPEKAQPRVLKSTTEGPTKRVWAIADTMKGAKRKDVVQACVEAGIATGTARTQYQKWLAASRG
jgi:hypothetical protein